MLAFACTIHKAQGLTLPSIVVSFNSNEQKKFNYGQLYVALSRVKSLGNLYIKAQATKEAFSVDADVEIECCRLKTQCCLISPIAVGFSVAIFNIRSLSEHILDNACNPFIRNVDTILLALLKENNFSHSILQYRSTLFEEFIVPLLQGLKKVSILLTFGSNNFNVQDFIGQIIH